MNMADEGSSSSGSEGESSEGRQHDDDVDATPSRDFDAFNPMKANMDLL
jgi:hypothetical protein